jgi:cytochrome c
MSVHARSEIIFRGRSTRPPVAIAAAFIHDDMPAGTTPDQPVPSPQDAWDVAAAIDAQDRP